MNTYIIGYDLNRPRGQDDYPNLIQALKALPNWWHYLDSTWIVKSSESAITIRNELQKHIDSGDELLVARLSGEAAWVGFNDTGSNWLKSNL